MTNSVYTSPTFSNANPYVAKQMGIMLSFNMPTYVGNEGFDPTTNINLFNPTNISIDQWLSTALSTGLMRAATLTTKTVDGFCLWPTATTTRDIAATSWYASGGFDIVGQFVTKCNAAGIAPILYLCIWDKKFELDNPGYTKAAYRAYIEAQITELLTNYGTIYGIWLDGGEWHFTDAYPWDSAAQRNAFIKALQPNIYIVSNSHLGTTSDTDIVVYEGGTAGMTIPAGNSNPAETVETVKANGSWYYKSGDSLKTYLEMLTGLNRTNGRGGVFNLNVTVDTTGRIPADQVALLAQMTAFRAA